MRLSKNDEADQKAHELHDKILKELGALSYGEAIGILMCVILSFGILSGFTVSEVQKKLSNMMKYFVKNKDIREAYDHDLGMVKRGNNDGCEYKWL